METQIVNPVKEKKKYNYKVKTGRKPKYDFADEKFLGNVERLGGLGFLLEQIAHILEIHPQTLTDWRRSHKEFDLAIKRGVDKANGKVVSCIFKNATDNMNLGAQIFWLKNKMGWRDDDSQQQLKFTNININFTNVSDSKPELEIIGQTTRSNGHHFASRN